VSSERSEPHAGAPEPGDVRSNEELTDTAGSALRWITFARIGIEITLLAGMVVLARLIPPAAFGMFAVVLIVQELALALPMEGVGSALVQRRSISRRHLCWPGSRSWPPWSS
jgi:hypothetical protein